MTNKIDLLRPNSTKPGFYRQLRRQLRLFVSTRPRLYAIYARHARLRFQLTDSTEVLVDSYPRSGNSFFEAAFTRAHGDKVEVAHHAHAAAQVLAGTRRGLPTIVLLREPEEAIASFFEMNGGDYPISLCTQEYVAFYAALEPVLDTLIVLETSAIEANFFDLMTLLRDRYRLDVNPYEIDATTRKELFDAVDATGRARNGFAAERYSESLSDAEKQARRARLESIRSLIRKPANARRLARAQALYEMFKSHAF